MLSVPTAWSALLARVRPHRRTLVLSMALALFGAAGGLAQPLAAREVIDALAGDESLLRPLLVLGGLVALSAVIVAANFWLLERTAERIVLGTRRELATRLLRLRLSALDLQAPGDLVARATSDSTLLGSVSSTALVQLVMGAITLVASIVLMGVVDLVLLGVTLAVLVVVGGAVALVLPRIMRATERQQEAVGGLGAALERALGGLRTVKASGAEERETRAVTEAAQRAYERGMESAGYQAMVGTATGLIVQVAFLAVLGVGGARVASGDMDVGDLIAFLLYLFYLADPITAVSQGATQLQQGLAAVKRIDEVARLPVEEDGAAAPAPARIAAAAAPTAAAAARDGAAPREPDGAEPPAPLVVFDRVSFGYRADGNEVLHEVSFEVPARGVTAIVGPSGAGKTTLFSLIERFYDPDAGEIRFHGRPLAGWPRAALRGQIGYVEQEAPVLAGTLRDNLLYAAPEAGEEALRAVLSEARLDELVARLPDGLDTEIAARGASLSGGERQRIAIARALLRRPALLLLDEAASQLDAVNEMALRDTVARAGESRAVLAIAHRLSTVVSARRIVVLEHGRVRATGTHAELVRDDSLYAALAATQFTAV
jgi:ABC-type multidrug transport system fused ATPase/permease subunit